MKRVLDPLAHVPGIRRAVLISKDGVPITHILSAQAGERSGEVHRDTADDLSAFAGMATGLLTEVHRSVDPMSWEDPERLVLRGARGTLVLHVTERVTLAVELERGMAPEELRLPMESVLDRLRRSLARKSARPEESHFEGEREGEEPPAPLPAQDPEPDDPPATDTSTGTEVPETTTEH